MQLPTRKILIALTGIVAAFATSVSAQINTISVDENGTFLINGAAAPPGVLAVEPISGILTLSYTLPFVANPGDVQLFATNEPPTAGQFSDLLRFNGNHLYFFSLKDDTSPPDLADVPALPPAIAPNMVIAEIGPEGNNSATWAPGPGGIGGTSTSPNLVYTFISDVVPEPSPWMLTVLSGGVLLVMRWRRQALRG
jgi:hypothetical protein